MELKLVILLAIISYSMALDNGLALTPPMGWLTWQRFRCIIDCDSYPDECISFPAKVRGFSGVKASYLDSNNNDITKLNFTKKLPTAFESLIKRMADIIIKEGYYRAGYNYVGIDDCWLEKSRDARGRLVPDRKRFPNGMKAVGDYLHGLGLKFALYQDYGNKTCMGYPGVLGHEELDVKTFAEWGVDYIKLDGCYVDVDEMDTGYPAFGKLMNESGRAMVYSCSWPAYQDKPDYESIAKHCNLWRNWDDIQDSWESLTTITNWFAKHQEEIVKYAGPGQWNDPDMLLIGNYGLSLDQAKVQMAIWSILAAPLLMSVDLATIRPEFKEVLLNRDIIAIDQDVLGKQGLRVWNKSKCEVWTREVSDGHAVAIVSHRDDGAPYHLTLTIQDINITSQWYEVQDLFKDGLDFSFGPGANFSTRVNPSGVRYYKFTPMKSNEVKGSSVVIV